MRVSSMEKDLLEVVLKKSQKEDSVAKILSVESSSVVGKFQNFLSTVKRLTMKVVLANGRVVNRYLIEKVADTGNPVGCQFQQKYDVFRIEIMVYELVLKEMDYLMEEFEDTEEALWCNLVHYVPYNCIVMEDLKASGFSMVDRNRFFDVEHSLLAVSSLAKFHGRSKLLQQRGVLSEVGFKPWFFCNDLEMHNYWASGINAMVEGIKKYWNPNWAPLVERINITVENLHEEMRKTGEFDDSRFNVLCHGDCNKNNLMFKYDWEKRPVSMKFVDFQIPFYGSPCCDLTYIIYLSVDPFVRKDNIDLLVETYHTSLCNTLDRYKFDGHCPSLEELQKDMEKHSFLGLFGFLATYPSLVKSEEMEVYFDFEKLIATQGKEGINLELYNSEALEKAMGPDLVKFVNKFF